MRWPDGIVRDTGIWGDFAESGKPRLRSTLTPEIQVGRIVAPMLMLPDPTREFRKTPVDLPIARAKEYTLWEVGFGDESELSGIQDLVTFVPSYVVVANRGHKTPIGVTARWARIVAVYASAGMLPINVQGLVKAHQEYLASGEIVTRRLTTIVSNIGKQLALLPNSNAAIGADPLPTLEEILGITPAPGPTLPPPNELGEDAAEVSVRSAHQYRRAKMRGAAGRKFSREVRAAYNYRCAFCGARFGSSDGIRSGVDAAHILAWNKYDLDVVQNGLALCKLHHWAFDAGIVVPVKVGTDYFIRFTMLANLIDEQSLSRIGADGQQIPDEWLPSDPKLRPGSKYLQRLYADLGVRFRGDS